MARTLGLGTALNVDENDSGSGYTAISLTVTATPPPRSWVRIDATVLGDSLATDTLGIEDKSDCSFTVYSEPNDTQHAMLRTLAAARAAVLWNITYASADIETFDAKIVSIVPAEIQIAGLVGETITIHRTAAIAYT